MRPFFPQSENESFLRFGRLAITAAGILAASHVIGGKNLSKDAIDKASDAIKHTVDDVKDSVHEGQHRSAADMEKAKREALGDELTPSEKVGSALNEAKHRTQAEIDAAKRDIRDSR
ncbi:MAG: hypothetical protein WAK11_14815 [Candidatus Cybelea sp.]